MSHPDSVPVCCWCRFLISIPHTVTCVLAHRLQTEREASLRLKGENGIMRKKFNALQKDIEGQREEIKSLFEQKKVRMKTKVFFFSSGEVSESDIKA